MSYIDSDQFFFLNSLDVPFFCTLDTVDPKLDDETSDKIIDAVKNKIYDSLVKIIPFCEKDKTYFLILKRDLAKQTFYAKVKIYFSLNSVYDYYVLFDDVIDRLYLRHESTSIFITRKHADRVTFYKELK